MAKTFRALSRARTATLSTAGFSALTAAAWLQFGLAAGLVVGGASCFVLEYLSGGDS